jgi:hypothetical protein
MQVVILEICIYSRGKTALCKVAQHASVTHVSVTDAPSSTSSALLRHCARVVRSREKPRDRLSSGYIRESAPFPRSFPTPTYVRLQAPHPSPPSPRRAIPEAPPAPPLSRRGSPCPDPNPMANSNLPRRIIKVCAPDLTAPAQISRPPFDPGHSCL